MMKTTQTVYVALRSSTVVNEATETVPIYEPAEVGSLNIVYHMESITSVDEYGICIELDVDTGKETIWYPRPKLADVVRKPTGHFYQFYKDGSIFSRDPVKGTCYWGPIEKGDSDAIGFGTARGYDLDEFRETHRMLKEAKSNA